MYTQCWKGHANTHRHAQTHTHAHMQGNNWHEQNKYRNVRERTKTQRALGESVLLLKLTVRMSCNVLLFFVFVCSERK